MRFSVRFRVALEPPLLVLAVPPDAVPALEAAPLVLAFEADALAAPADPVAVPVPAVRFVDRLCDVDEPAAEPVADPEPAVEPEPAVDRERLREVDPEPPVDVDRDERDLELEVEREPEPDDAALVDDEPLPPPSESELHTSGEGMPLVRFAT
ncbi:hypothetical protein [Halopiger thermotolerans]